jgi:limonene-1,2-epoxide hydrolase
MTGTNEEVLRGFLAKWNVRDAEGMAETFTEDGIYENVPEGKPMQGREAIRAWLDGIFANLSRIDVEILHVASNSEWVLSERVDDHIAGDKHMPLPVMNVSRIVDGRIALFRDYYDQDMVRALGML